MVDRFSDVFWRMGPRILSKFAVIFDKLSILVPYVMVFKARTREFAARIFDLFLTLDFLTTIFILPLR